MEHETVTTKRWFQMAMDAGSGLKERLTSLVYPPACIACQGATGVTHALCAACWSRMGFISRPYCERLGTPFAVDLGGQLLSPQAMADPPVFARARAVARYDDTARELVHRLKYGDRTELAQAMARMMVQAGHELLAEAEVIVPVPLHRFRLWSRRFNQAALLAREIGRMSDKPLALQGVMRVRRTKPQVGLSRDQRRLNLQGAFRPGPEAALRIEGRRVLLVDDVLTTGATANAAARTLLRAGAKCVDVLTFARVVPGDG
jgi:ComF family protein